MQNPILILTLITLEFSIERSFYYYYYTTNKVRKKNKNGHFNYTIKVFF